MLSRVADSLFWLGRNVERAETVARILDVTYSRAMDHYAPGDGRAERLWRSVVRSVGFASERLVEETTWTAESTFDLCAFSATASVVSAVRIARSNALGVRAELTTEVWETINVIYLYAEAQNRADVLRAGPSRFLRKIRDAMQAFAGVSDATLAHADSWNFLQVGRFLERAYLTSRMIASVDAEREPWPESQRLLEMCCASEPFAHFMRQSPEPRDAIGFIAVAPDFPRSLRFCTRKIDDAMHRLSGTPNDTCGIDAERRLGRLRARFDYTTIDELLAPGRDVFASQQIHDFERLTVDIETAYFPRLPVAVPVA